MYRSVGRLNPPCGVSRRSALASLGAAAVGVVLGGAPASAWAQQGLVRLVVAGDCAFTADVSEAIAAGAYEPFASLDGMFQSADIAFVNLESVLASPHVPRRPFRPGAPVLRGDTSAAEVLARGGVDVVSVANNHVFDLGGAGLRESNEALRRAGITPVGAGSSRDEALQPFVREVGGTRIGILAFTQFVNHAPDDGAAAARTREDMAAAVQSLRAKVDAVVVSLHWGEQFKQRASQLQTDIAHRLVDAGADAIVGHHPHVLQGVEVYRGRPILYSLGNFLWGRQTNPVEHSAFAELMLAKGEPRVARLRIYLVHRSPPLGLPRIVTGREARFVRGSVVGASLRFRTRMAEVSNALEVGLGTTE